MKEPNDFKRWNKPNLGLYELEIVWGKFWAWWDHHAMKISIIVKAPNLQKYLPSKCPRQVKRPHERRYPWGLWELIQLLNSPLEIKSSKKDARDSHLLRQTIQAERYSLNRWVATHFTSDLNPFFCNHLTASADDQDAPVPTHSTSTICLDFL